MTKNSYEYSNGEEAAFAAAKRPRGANPAYDRMVDAFLGTKPTNEACDELAKAGYTVLRHPCVTKPTNLIIKLRDRTVTTLPVKDGGVCAESVAYLVSEQGYAKDAGRQ